MTSFWTPLRIALAGSFVLHALIWIFFGFDWIGSAVGGPTGTVSVDFIEPVVHQGATSVSPVAPRAVHKKKKPSRSREVTAPPSGAEDAAAPLLPTPSEASGGGGRGGAPNEFVQAITKLIDARKLYPRAAIRREWEGRVIVAITLEQDGTLRASGVELPCPFPLLNEAALEAVRGVAKYPPLPAGSGPTLHLHVPIVFKISRK